MDTSQTNATWYGVDLSLNIKACEMAHAEFVATNKRTPETLTELQSIWRRQSVILSGLKK